MLNPDAKHGDESPAEAAFDDTLLQVLEKRRKYFLSLKPNTHEAVLQKIAAQLYKEEMFEFNPPEEAEEAEEEEDERVTLSACERGALISKKRKRITDILAPRDEDVKAAKRRKLIIADEDPTTAV